jgi:hypothetical protein
VQEIKFPKELGGEIALNPVTPEHSGRKFTNFLPSQGELVLPIRGEKVIKTSEDLKVDEDINDKAEKLQQLLEQIKQKEGIKAGPSPQINTPAAQVPPKPVIPAEQPAPAEPVPVQEPKKEGEINNEAQQAAQKLKTENDSLSKQISDLKTEINVGKAASKEMSSQEQLLIKLELQQKKAATDYEALNRQIIELQNRLKEKETSAAEAAAKGQPAPVAQTYAKIQPLTNKPNVISGVIKDSTGKELENVLMIVKNSHGEPVRAFKSNTLGQFALSTPLINGIYTIEVSPVNNISQTFDIISVEVKGDVIPPLEIMGR